MRIGRQLGLVVALLVCWAVAPIWCHGATADDVVAEVAGQAITEKQIAPGEIHFRLWRQQGMTPEQIQKLDRAPMHVGMGGGMHPSDRGPHKGPGGPFPAMAD